MYSPTNQKSKKKMINPTNGINQYEKNGSNWSGNESCGKYNVPVYQQQSNTLINSTKSKLNKKATGRKDNLSYVQSNTSKDYKSTLQMQNVGQSNNNMYGEKFCTDDSCACSNKPPKHDFPGKSRGNRDVIKMADGAGDSYRRSTNKNGEVGMDNRDESSEYFNYYSGDQSTPRSSHHNNNNNNNSGSHFESSGTMPGGHMTSMVVADQEYSQSSEYSEEESDSESVVSFAPDKKASGLPPLPPPFPSLVSLKAGKHFNYDTITKQTKHKKAKNVNAPKKEKAANGKVSKKKVTKRDLEIDDCVGEGGSKAKKAKLQAKPRTKKVKGPKKSEITNEGEIDDNGEVIQQAGGKKRKVVNMKAAAVQARGKASVNCNVSGGKGDGKEKSSMKGKRKSASSSNGKVSDAQTQYTLPQYREIESGRKTHSCLIM